MTYRRAKDLAEPCCRQGHEHKAHGKKEGNEPKRPIQPIQAIPINKVNGDMQKEVAGTYMSCTQIEFLTALTAIPMSSQSTTFAMVVSVELANPRKSAVMPGTTSVVN